MGVVIVKSAVAANSSGKRIISAGIRLVLHFTHSLSL